ncbi:uncharacterized protein LOC128245032 [Mya arenaria]|uniref:uncharacterized protein LOC128245032 n=1 Tax=Mya arenaria TaxID=6604 RepID=UPI0022DEDB17|nr:uncharacterized protein LOC128245032 [Mya arenaria]
MKLQLFVIIAGLVCAVSCSHFSAKELEKKEDDPIKDVHLIFMNHLDVGYSFNNKPGHVLTVINAYFQEYFPRAVKTALDLYALGYVERFIYTTHPWLVSLYLDCPPNVVLSGIKLQCPDEKSKESFTDVVKVGFITWHAGPMNMEYEMMDESMLEFAMQLSMDLDARFGFQRKHRTVSQRDVPGTTKAIIPILNKLGIHAMSIGVNGATAPADVPPVFLWKNGNSSLITLYHPGGYPAGYGPSPFRPGGLSRKDCAVVKGLSHALCFAFRSDNQGPPQDYKEVLTVYEIARAQFPNARVHASTFENFTSLLVPFASQLPIVTKEIGDVWIQGSGSDPRKTAEMRAMYRARSLCMEEGKCKLSDPRVYNASRFMLKHSEHTWGSAGNSVDNINWDNSRFYKILNTPNNIYKNATLFWDEQRNFTNLALEALGNHTLANMIREEFQQLRPEIPETRSFKTGTPNSDYTCGSYVLRFNSQGVLSRLKDSAGREWASDEFPMGQFVYHTYSANDFQEFFNATTPYSKDFFLGIGKPNMSKNAQPISNYWETQMDSLLVNEGIIIASLSMVNNVTRTYYGAPAKISLQYNCLDGIWVTVQWFGKVPTRLPEDLTFVFTPAPQTGLTWRLNKIEDMIDPLDVVTNGSQRLHAINRGVFYTDPFLHGLEITSLDSAVVNILTDQQYVSMIPVPLKPISSVQGVAFNLYNNVWETNYIFWYPYCKEDIDQKFRFYLNFM